ncbi:unnamed protein product, partial [Chrysoparadoxa australica]
MDEMMVEASTSAISADEAIKRGDEAFSRLQAQLEGWGDQDDREEEDWRPFQQQGTSVVAPYARGSFSDWQPIQGPALALGLGRATSGAPLALTTGGASTGANEGGALDLVGPSSRGQEQRWISERIDVRVNVSLPGEQPCVVYVQDILPERLTIRDLKDQVVEKVNQSRGNRPSQLSSSKQLTLYFDGQEFPDDFGVGAAGIVTQGLTVEVRSSTAPDGSALALRGLDMAKPRQRPEELAFFEHLWIFETSGAETDEGERLLDLLHAYRTTIDSAKDGLADTLQRRQYGLTSSMAGAIFQREADLLEDTRQERDTWDLMHLLEHNRQRDIAIMDDAAKDPSRFSVEHTTLNPLAGDALVTDALFERSASWRLLEAAKRWLEDGAQEYCEGLKGLDGSAADKLPWEVTLARQRRGRAGTGGGGISGMDPDATFTLVSHGGDADAMQGSDAATVQVRVHALDGRDEKDEADLLRAVWLLLRAGRLPEAVSLCIGQGYHWRAASLAGGALISTGEYKQQPDDGGVELAADAAGNARRSLWRHTCWKLSEGIKLGLEACGGGSDAAAYESVIYALLAGDLHTLVTSPILRSWEDQAWAMIVCSRQRRLDEELLKHREAQEAASKLYPGVDVLRHDRSLLESTAEVAGLTMRSIFERLKGSSYPEVRKQSSSLYHQVQAGLLLGAEAICDVVTGVLHPVAFGPEGTVTALPHTLRFLAHLCLALSQSFPHLFSKGAARSACQDLVCAYAEYLAKSREMHLVGIYCAHLEQSRRINVYASFCSTIMDDQDRMVCLEKAQQHLPQDVLSILNKVVRDARLLHRSLAPEAGSVSRGDLYKMRAIGWLCLEETPALKAMALLHANALIRQFMLHPYDIEPAAEATVDLRAMGQPTAAPDSTVGLIISGRVQAADLLLRGGKFMPPLEDIVHVLNSSPDQIGLPPSVVDSAIDEHQRWGDLLSARDAFCRWTESLVSCKPRAVPQRPTASKEEEMRLARDVKEHAEETRRLTEELLGTASAARTALLKVLECRGGWLVYNSQVGGDEEGRAAELVELRRRCIPELVFMLHKVLHGTGDWCLRYSAREDWSAAAVWYQACQQLADLVADDRYGLYRIMDKPQLKKLL